jgi:hypothetical protein
MFEVADIEVGAHVEYEGDRLIETRAKRRRTCASIR